MAASKGGHGEKVKELRPLPVPVVWIRIGNVTTRVLWERLSPVLADILDAIDGGESVVEIV